MALQQLLVTTWQALLYVVVDMGTGATEERKVLHTGAGIYFGISWDLNHLYVLARNYETTRKNSLLVFDKEFRLANSIDLGAHVSEAHQIQVYRGKLYICNTQRNSLAVMDLATHQLADMRPMPATVGANVNHINSVKIENDIITLVAANRYRNSFFIDLSVQGQILAVDALGLSCHNIIDCPWGRLTCDSFHGAVQCWRTGYDEQKKEHGMHTVYLHPDSQDCVVLSLSMARGNLREKRGAPVFPRGLALCGESLYVGLSDNNKRELRYQSGSRIFAIESLPDCLKSLGQGSPARTFEIGPHGAVMDLRVVGAEDLGHPGTVWPDRKLDTLDSK